MGIDNSSDFDNAKNKLNSFKDFNSVNQSIKNAQAKVNQFKQKVSSVQQGLDSAKIDEEIKRRVSSSLEQMIEMFAMTRGASSSATEFLRSKFTKIVQKIQPILYEILSQEMVSALGCSNEQSYDPIEVYLKVSSIDLFKCLIIDPNTAVGKSYYESKDFNSQTINSTSRPTNRMLYQLLQNEGQPLSSLYSSLYNGISTQPLFDIVYVTFNPETGQNGKYYKITLQSKLDGVQRVTDFLVDYLKTIDLIDLKGFITRLIDLVLNIFTVNVGFGSATIDDSSKFGLIIQRILGLCFDFDEEINIGGSAKTPEIDNVNDSFFEFTDLDLRLIEQRTANIKAGVVQFEDCNNVLLPITDTDYALNEINLIQQDGENMNSVVNNVLNSITNDPRWSLKFPFPNELKLSINNDLIKNFPLAVAGTLLSPKILLPFILMYKALGKVFDDTAQGVMGFVKEFKKFVIGVASKIGAIFVRALFEEIKKEILKLTKSIIQDIKNEVQSTKAAVILTLLEGALIIINAINDFRKCKNLLQLLLQLFSLKIPQLGRITPPFLLPLAASLPGTSPTRQFLNTIENMQKLGLPTGPNRDGSANLGLQAQFSQLKGAKKDQDENGKIEAYVESLAGGGLGYIQTQPNFNITGKYF
jgi:hypothetical protein